MNFSHMLTRNMLLLLSITVILALILTTARSIFLRAHNFYPYHKDINVANYTSVPALKPEI